MDGRALALGAVLLGLAGCPAPMDDDDDSSVEVEPPGGVLWALFGCDPRDDHMYISLGVNVWIWASPDWDVVREVYAVFPEGPGFGGRDDLRLVNEHPQLAPDDDSVAGYWGGGQLALIEDFDCPGQGNMTVEVTIEWTEGPPTVFEVAEGIRWEP